jgi:molybdopterin/thiamine biosynthesis adenylyltransferase
MRPGVAIELNDQSGFIRTVCKNMDGLKTFEELSNVLVQKFPYESCYLQDLLITLDQEYLLEDVSKNNPNELSLYDVTRWSRNIEFFSSYCKASANKYLLQEKLKKIKVAILGLGGVGSNILYNLAALGVCNMKVLDYDEVELSNLNRQIIYNESDIGSLKSEAAKKRINEFLPNANIIFSNKKITCREDIEEIIHDQDFVIGAIDHPRDKIMYWLNSACSKFSIPLLCGSLDSRVAMYYSIIPGKTGCIQCWEDNASKSSPLFNKLIQEQDFNVSNSPNVAIMPIISILSGLLSSEFLKAVTQIGPLQSEGNLCMFDFMTSQVTISESWTRNPDCSICS